MRDAESFCSFMTRIDDNTPQRAWIEFDKVIVAAEEAGFNDIVPISFDKVVSDGGIIAALSEACGVPDGGETRVNTSSVKVDIDMLRLFNGIRGGGVADALSPMRVRLGNGGARPRIFAQTPIVGGLLLRNPILAEKLRSMLDNTRAEVTLDPSMFGGWQSHFERSIARYCNDHSAFFGEVKAVTRTYSTLEIEDIPESLRKEMRTALWREILRVRVVRSRWLGRLRRVAFRLMPSYS
ncbi:hypothetical protein So717_03920 [Roseobacter cerasinus]|uniref:Uncharacterized protein n=2 Tax=Roseobacter cerasinus TaxID=2602289 RepID=A0A640VKN1_9RHOB|nr:hypothetical protein So717_03920 [Roseobacter cerasinus]